MCCARRARNGEPCQPQTLLTPLRIRPCAWIVLAVNIAIHRKPHTVLRRLAVQLRTVFGDAPCLKLSVDGYIACAALWLILTALARHGDIAPITPGTTKAVLCLYLLFNLVARNLCDGQASARRQY